MTVPTNRESDKFVLRLPDGMRDRIKAAAEVANRSMNAEIVATLEDKYPAPQLDSKVMSAFAFEVGVLVQRWLAEGLIVLAEDGSGRLPDDKQKIVDEMFSQVLVTATVPTLKK